MRWVRQLQREHGAAAPLLALMLIPMIGAVGLGVDVGAMYSEKAQLQNGADAAALQIAVACAANEAASGCSSDGADAIAGQNALDGNAAIESVAINRGANLVTVQTKSEDLGVRHPFAAILPGVGDSSVVKSSAQAEWGLPIKGSTIAITIGYCELADQVPQLGVANPERILLEYHNDAKKVCRNSLGELINAPGGFGWLPSLDCSYTVDLGDPWIPSKTGNSTSGTGCDDAYLASLRGSAIYIPIFDDVRGTGVGSEFHISQFAAFQVTGVKVSGSNEYTDPLAPSCKGNCRGLQGYFTKLVSVDDAFQLSQPPPCVSGTPCVFTNSAAIARLTLRTS
ncbi:MAG TPA: Tad domain-containing protein [Candidatus Lumbricidophila sp.]|nr:Tad domain-containing protein [Candidatus Lumbricidophila sp.]